jgi:hypothetical protein
VIDEALVGGLWKKRKGWGRESYAYPDPRADSFEPSIDRSVPVDDLCRPELRGRVREEGKDICRTDAISECQLQARTKDDTRENGRTIASLVDDRAKDVEHRLELIRRRGGIESPLERRQKEGGEVHF